MKNDWIELWRFLFTLLIAAFHFDNYYHLGDDLGIHAGSYIAVEFFFMVSGYLLAAHVQRERERAEASGRAPESNFAYLRGRIIRLYPAYILSVFITFGIVAAVYRMGVREMIEKAADNIWEFVLLQCAGLGRGADMINPTAWYVSALVITSFFLHWLLTEHEKLFTGLLGPLAVLASYSYFYRTVGSLDAWQEAGSLLSNHALIRAFADLTLGTLAFAWNRECGKKDGSGICRIRSAIALLAVILCSTVKGYSRLDFVFSACLFLGIVYGFRDSHFALPKGLSKLCGISYEIYLIHHALRAFVFPIWIGRILMPSGALQKAGVLLLYLITSVLAGALLHLCAERLGRVFVNRQNGKKERTNGS